MTLIEPLHELFSISGLVIENVCLFFLVFVFVCPPTADSPYIHTNTYKHYFTLRTHAPPVFYFSPHRCQVPKYKKKSGMDK